MNRQENTTTVSVNITWPIGFRAYVQYVTQQGRTAYPGPWRLTRKGALKSGRRMATALRYLGHTNNRPRGEWT